MSCFFGIDTSNYTTSAAIFEPQTGKYVNSRRILEVGEGSIGLRQSEALFQHTRNLPEIAKKALEGCGSVTAVGVSDRPRPLEDSYMPCFLAGVSAAECVAAALGVKLYKYSHQAGHIAAALLSSDSTDLIGKPFISFHVSGGTTEAVLVTYNKDKVFDEKIVARSLDLKMGQAVDRIGNMLGLHFPAGKELDFLSQKGNLPRTPSVCIKGVDCSLSGLENQAKKLIDEGAPREDVALYTIEFICKTLDRMTAALKAEYSDLPFVFAGGVMSNSIISKKLTEKYGVRFASAELSSDNAVGIAYLTSFIADGGGN